MGWQVAKKTKRDLKNGFCKEVEDMNVRKVGTR